MTWFKEMRRDMSFKLSVLFTASAALGVILSNLASGQQPSMIPGWGTITDPGLDSNISAEGGRLTISVPGGRHDLWFGGTDAATKFNAPRVWQELEGDFVVTVKVINDWSSVNKRGTYVAAGLLLWDSENQYLRHERNRMWSSRSETPLMSSYLAPLYDKDQRRGYFLAQQGQHFATPHTWLRLDRVGNEIRAFVCHDDKTWNTTGNFSTDFPAKIKIGVHVVAVTDDGFQAHFEQLKIEKR
jgi:regulation of enolase protein 1 (concanavalin A-like superfamily)